MKNTTKIIWGVGVVAVIIATAILSSNSELFQGYSKLLPKKITPLITEKPLMLVLFSEDTGYPIQISGDSSSPEAAINVDNCGTTGEGEKWCNFEYSDKNNNNEMINLVKDRDNFTLYGNSGYNYNIKVVDVTDFPEDSTQSERAVIELSKVKK